MHQLVTFLRLANPSMPLYHRLTQHRSHQPIKLGEIVFLKCLLKPQPPVNMWYTLKGVTALACNMMTAEIEGIKLDIVVLQNQLQTRNKSEEFEIDTQSVRKENKKLKEIINSNTRKHENEIDCLRAKLNSLETTLIKVEEERDSLRTVLTLITQDQKHERNNMGRKIEDCSWQKVGNSNRKQKSNHNKHPASSASINRFELLSDSDVS